MSDTFRAIFVGGPLDGRIETAHRPDAGGVVVAIDRDPAGDPAGEEALTQVLYRGLKLRDLDGTEVLVYALEDRIVDGKRPEGFTIWELAVDATTYRREAVALRGAVSSLEADYARALRQVDTLAGELRNAREIVHARRAPDERTSGDA